LQTMHVNRSNSGLRSLFIRCRKGNGPTLAAVPNSGGDDVRNLEQGHQLVVHQKPGRRTMTTTAREVFVVGLRNAHSMEVQARELMERQSERLDDYPDVQAKVKEHLAETNQQLKRLEQCLEACGETSSTLKDATQSVMANMTAMAHAMAGDEILKNTFANNAFEHFEIAAYKSLLSLCMSAGQEKSRPMLEANLKEEEQMAAWIDANVAKVTHQYVANQELRAA
jgi:ferritin-like metal-binding protein YciE